MAQPGGEDVYATMLLNDAYLPGCLVLAHSLRDGGTTKKLAVLVTTDTVSAEAITQLRAVFDHVISVARIRNDVSPANLDQMNRPDLHSAFTKINLWNQVQFRRIVYIDADVVAYRAPDELFELPHAFAAAPDIGWPDCFNTGVMVITPSVAEYQALLALAQQGVSFDGADQGLLNMHFKDSYHRLSFKYNVTPSAHYQYLPAYRHFQSSITMVHFIGSDKPWSRGRGVSTGNSAYNEMVGQWWSVYERHYSKAMGFSRKQGGLPEAFMSPAAGRPLMESSWDAQRHFPPVNARPEAMNLPRSHYNMSQDTKLFVPPVEASAMASQKPNPIFPWEDNQPTAARVFAEPPPPPPPPSYEAAVAVVAEEPAAEPEAAPEVLPQTPEAEPAMPAMESGPSSVDLKTEPTTPTMPEVPVRQYPPSDPWASFTRTNAWDDVPQIERYVDSFQRMHFRTRSRGQVFGGTRSGASAFSNFERPRVGGGGQWGSRVTDFPSEAERPSLPVTPAPIRRPKYWGGSGPGFGAEGDADAGDHLLPTAKGVPQQSDWDPIAQLQKLAKHQSEVLLRRLGPEVGAENGSETGKTEERESTYVAEMAARVVSPTPVKPGGLEMSRVHNMGNDSGAPVASGSTVAYPSYSGPGLAFEKDEGLPDREMAAALPSEEEMDVLTT